MTPEMTPEPVIVQLNDHFYRWQEITEPQQPVAWLAAARLVGAQPGVVCPDTAASLYAFAADNDLGHPDVLWDTCLHAQAFGVDRQAATANLIACGAMPQGPYGSLNKAMRACEKAVNSLLAGRPNLAGEPDRYRSDARHHLLQGFCAANEQRSAKALHDAWMHGYKTGAPK